ncbi:hypothetical protein B0H21DRAFT_695074 [Amylocystis lapponica]|nr:hypothetical protein B0H21DRAFT_695074 [Amylocystis lapponica]
MLHTLVLRGVHATPRTVVLDLGKLFLQIQLHTHVTVQPYTRGQWDSEISQVTSAKRGFRIGMALDFGEYVLAFVTLDNIFTPHWGRSLADLPIQHADVYHEYHAFLSAVATWIDTRRLSKNTKQLGLAVNAVRGANRVFGGIGVYTIIEVFYLAGLSVFLTEYELFSCPSRIARFCEAFWIQFLEPQYHGFILAATKAQRRRYSYWLHVYGKKATNMSLRMAQLRQEYCAVTRSERRGLFDVFEPTLIQAALQKELNLGHLIFGESQWRNMGGAVPAKPDPLTKKLRAIGILFALFELCGH